MECKFLNHGLAVAYDHVLKPCCEWRYNQDWAATNHLRGADAANWHQSDALQSARKLLADNQWPKACISCQQSEGQNRFDSMRHNGNRAYSDYQGDDITLEIRPGSVCNFACQTCWPEASSRVAQYYHQAGLIDIKNVNSTIMEDFDWILPLVHRIKDVVLLGGEPFYDKSCRHFLSWAIDHLQSRMTMFTNGSHVDFDFVAAYREPLCIVVSLDAIGPAAEYIRYGSEWSSVWSNYMKLKDFDHVELRVNITLSAYNYLYVTDLITLLCQDWPACVSFGHPRQSWLNEWAWPTHHRQQVIHDLSCAITTLQGSKIESGQKHNAINALLSVIANLQNLRPWCPDDTKTLREFCAKMDKVKGVNLSDYCPALAEILKQ